MSELLLTTGQYSDKGVKSINQDFCGFRTPDGALAQTKGALFALADGISSSDVSQIASETAVSSILEDYYCTADSWTVGHSLKQVISATNTWLYAHTLKSPYRQDFNRGYVCTFSCLVLRNFHAHIYHLGDSRVYRLAATDQTVQHDSLKGGDRRWQCLTTDHSDGYLTKALGMALEARGDYQQYSLMEGDVFMQASDGAYEFINSNDLQQVLRIFPDDFSKAAELLVRWALQRGSRDNLSVQICRVDRLPKRAIKPVSAETDLPILSALQPGQEIDGFHVLRCLQHNSRSHIYLVERDGKKLVLKAPAQDLVSDSETLQYFLQEEWVARRVRSSHVVKSWESKQMKTALYSVFHYVEGQTLAQWVCDRKPTLQQVRSIVGQLAKAIHALHRMDMLHRDIRPENIIIDDYGTVTLIDLGSVYISGLEDSQPAVRSWLAGTALYSAPEYFLGLPGSTKSDIFSLAVVVYFLLSGRYPYGNGVARAKSQKAQQALAYKTVLDSDSEIPAWIDYALRKALCVDPEKRYEQLFEFVHDLNQAAPGFLRREKPALVERNPLLVWQSIAAIQMIVILIILLRN